MSKFLFGLFCGVIVATLVVYYLNSTDVKLVTKSNRISIDDIAESLVPSTKLKVLESMTNIQQQSTTESRTNYDFYGILQNKDDNSQINNLAYFIQAGSFTSESDANAMKAQISLLGYDVKIKVSQGEFAPMNRVVLGPYASYTDAKYVQQDLQNNGIKTIILQIK